MKTRISLILAVSVLGGCSSLPSMSSLNPFSSSEPKEKMAELESFTASAVLKTQWQGSIGQAGDYVFTPAVVGNSVFVAGADGALARFDSGKEVWKIRAEQALTSGVGSDGNRVVVGTLKGEVLAFDGNGKALWKARVSSEVLAAPAVAENVVVVRSGDNRLTAFAADTGKRLWSFQRPTPALTLRSSAGVAIGAQGVFAGFPGGKLLALKLSNGSPVWEATVAIPKGSTELERIADVTSDPVISGRLVCAAAYQGRVACFDGASGEGIWARDISSSRGVDADRQYLYVTDDKGSVFALDKDNGASIWKQDKLTNRGVTRPVALPGYVAVADAKGVVHLLRRENGAFAARIETDGNPVKASPVAYGRTALVVQTSRGGIYALEP